MTDFFLIRHASVDGLGERIHGRSPGVRLNSQGRLDACTLAERLADSGIVAIYSSPQDRAQQTADALRRRLGLAVIVDADLAEIDYGEWTGRYFTELNNDPAWHRFNASREQACIPGGESLPQTAQRTTRALQHLSAGHSPGPIALVTHADWIRTAVCHALSIPFASLLRFEISPASVTVLTVENCDVRVLAWNDNGSSLTSRYLGIA